MAITPKPVLTALWAETGAKSDPGDPKVNQGWLAEIPPHQYQNFWQNRADNFLAHINEGGIPEWDSATTYEIISVTRGSDGSLYSGLQAANVGNDPTVSPAWWQQITGGGLYLDQLSGATPGNIVQVKAGGIQVEDSAVAVSQISTNTGNIGTNAGNISTLQGTAPTVNQNAALAGTGTPGAGDKYVNESTLNSLIPQKIFLADLKAQGTAPQSLTNGIWNVRNVQDTFNDVAGSSVVADTITLPTGTYEISDMWSGADLNCGNKLRFQNTTLAATVVVGNYGDAAATSSASGFLRMPATRFTVAAATENFQIQHYFILGNIANTTAGRPGNIAGSQESYLGGIITKIS